MSLNRRNKYGSDWGQPSAESPQGPFTNRSAPDSEDGSWMEKDWANDMFDGLHGALLTAAGYTPNGNVDTAISSQVFDALLNKKWTQFANYEVGTIVKGSDGNQYYCNKANGRSSTPIDPVTDGLDNWRQYPYKKIENSNGTAIVHHDGRMECMSVINTPSQSQVVNFASAFIENPLITMGTDSQEGTDVVGRFKGKTLTGFTISLTGSSVSPFDINYIAIGRWI